MVAVVKKSSTPLCRLAIPKVFVVISLVFLFAVVSWQLPTLLPFSYMNQYSTTVFDRYNFDDDIKEFKRAIKKLRGDDLRLVQWDATDHTKKYQKKVCTPMLPIAITKMIDITSLLQQQQPNQRQKQQSETSVIRLLQTSLEICTLCITDNPNNREIFSIGIERNEEEEQDDTDTIKSSTLSIHDAVVYLLEVPALTSYAAHLIYIASFANRNNYNGFVKANAVATLSDIMLSSQGSSTTTPYSIMWVAAALQNLAASYCTTPDDGRCYWEWKKQKIRTDSNNDDKTSKKEKNTVSFEYVLQLTSDSGKMVIDGTAVRQEIMSTPHIIDRLLQHTCSGPVREKMSNMYPYPGRNAIRSSSNKNENHELSPTIVPWATTGVLKNLMLDPNVRTTFLQQHSWSMSCFCYMSKSKDWLEANKGEGVLQHLRIDSDPCWFNFQSTKRDKKLNQKKTKKSKVLCIDQIFLDGTGNTCEAYSDEETLTNADCTATSIIDPGMTRSASDACCSCGGGDYYTGPGELDSGEIR